MDRRKFVAGLGALAGGGAIATGTGAFSSIEAERNLSVSVAEDSNAYLGIEALDDEYIDATDDTLDIALTKANPTTEGGEGINASAVTGIGDLFEVTNQGTQNADVFVQPLTFLDLDTEDVELLAVFLTPQDPDYNFITELEFFPEEPTSFPGAIAYKNIDPGESLRFGLTALAAPDAATGSVEINDSISIIADQNAEENPDP